MTKQTTSKGKIHSTIYYSENVYQLLKMLTEDTGLTQTAVVELAIRDLAKRRKIVLAKSGEEQDGE
jgi:hypothetical protein